MPIAMNVKELARQVKKLSPEEKCYLVQLVPELLRLDEEFLLHRRQLAQEDLECGRAITAEEALAKAKAKRRAIK